MKRGQVIEKQLQPNGRWKKPPGLGTSEGFVKDYCRYCGSKTGLTADHIHPKSRGGAKHISNLQPLCSYCNNRKGSLTELEIITSFRDIESRGVWYAWEEKLKNWRDYLLFVCEERSFNCPLLTVNKTVEKS
jgi:hypothetical protein